MQHVTAQYRERATVPSLRRSTVFSLAMSRCHVVSACFNFIGGGKCSVNDLMRMLLAVRVGCSMDDPDPPPPSHPAINLTT
jgi:hypothetical protein